MEQVFENIKWNGNALNVQWLYQGNHLGSLFLISRSHTQFTTSLYSIICHSNNALMCAQKNIGIIVYAFGDKAIEFGGF
jgi:hypothetical protein